MSVASLLVAFVSVAASSIWYTWVWHRPNEFKKLVSPEDPCKVMALYANILKVIQISSICVCTDWSIMTKLAPWQYLLMTALIAFGQHLNFLVYKLLGMNGVYYGVRFGKSIPWVTAYPYNTMRDPQYIGSMLTLLGCAFVIPTEVTIFWFMNYVYLMFVESKVPSSIA